MSRRGEIGWATDLLGRLLAQRSDHGRVVRGKELTDTGRVHDLGIAPGRVTAEVTGSRSEPYRVTVELASDGGPPTEPGQLRFTCSCPDWGDPCKHGVAVVLAVAERLDSAPEEAGTWWGGISPEPTLRSQPGPAPSRRQALDRGVAGAPRYPLPAPDERPAWADAVEATPAATTLEAWLGGIATWSTPPPRRIADPVATILELGPLPIDDVDLAPTIALLVAALVDPDVPS
jgi:hypothetical protein